MLNKYICSRVITIGCSYKPIRGGIAQLLHNYNKLIFSKFNFIPNSKSGNSLINLLYFVISTIRFILKLIFCRNLRIVHIHSASYNSFWRSYVFIKVGNKFNKKVVLHIHGGDFEKFYLTNKTKITNILNLCDSLIVLSKYWCEFFNNITDTPCMIIENLIENPINNNPKDESSIVNFIFLGLIDGSKGIYDVLSVINQYQDQFRDKIILRIGGNGDVTSLKIKINEYGISDIVKYIGWVSGLEKEQVLELSDVFILPSYAEGLPLSIVEAMSYNQAIISSNIGGIPEVVDHTNGFLITPGDKDTLYIYMRTLIESEKLRKSLGNNSFRKANNYLSPNVESKLHKLYRSLI